MTRDASQTRPGTPLIKRGVQLGTGTRVHYIMNYRQPLFNQKDAKNMLQTTIHNRLLRNFGDDLMQQVGSGAATAVGGLPGMAIGLGMNAIGGLIQHSQQQGLSEQQEAMNEKLSAFNFAQQKQFWDETNAEAQVKHLEAAGLNPALMYAKGGPGGSTGAPSGGVQGATAQNPGMGIQANSVAMQEAQADIHLKEAQAENIQAQTTKTTGVDTQQVQAQIDQVKQLTQNAQVQNSILQWEAGIKSAEATVATNTIETNIQTLQTQFQKLQQEVRSTTTAADISQATKDEIIQQARNATIAQGLQMILTKAQTGSTQALTQETINNIQMSIQKNMREWDLMPNMDAKNLEQLLTNNLKQDIPNIGEELLKNLTHFILPLKIH